MSRVASGRSNIYNAAARAKARKALRRAELLAAAVAEARDPFEARRVGEAARRLLLALVEEARRIRLHLAALRGKVLKPFHLLEFGV